MIALTVPDTYAVVVVSVVITGVLSWSAYMMREVRRISEALAIVSAHNVDHARRIERLEAFRDGMQFGRSAHEWEQRTAAAALDLTREEQRETLR